MSAHEARVRKLADRIRVVVAETLEMRVKDPRLGFVTITDARVSGDLREATVFYTVMGENRDHRRTRAGLMSARSHLRATLGHQVRLKFTPELEFEEDVGLAQLDRVTELLRQIGSEQPAEGAGEQAE